MQFSYYQYRCCMGNRSRSYKFLVSDKGKGKIANDALNCRLGKKQFRIYTLGIF